MSNGYTRPRVWRPEQRNEAPSPIISLNRQVSWQSEQGYVPSTNDWEWTVTPTTHQVGPSSSHGGRDYGTYGGLVLVQERRGPFLLPRITPMLNDHMATSYPRLIMQSTIESARRSTGQLSREVSVPRQEDQSRQMNIDEQEALLSKLKKEVYYPKTPMKSLAKRLSSFYKNNNNEVEVEEEEDDGKRSCVVCLEDFMPYEAVMTTPCSHMFHEDCIVPWMKSNGKCPVCRAVIYEKRNERLPSHDNGRARDNNRSTQIGAFELIALVRAMEESIGWG